MLSASPWDNPFGTGSVNSDDIANHPDILTLAAVLSSGGSGAIGPTASLDLESLDSILAGRAEGEAATSIRGPRLSVYLSTPKAMGPLSPELGEGEDDWFVNIWGSGTLYEETQNTRTITLQREGPTVNAISVGLQIINSSSGLTSGDYVISQGGVPISGMSVTIPANSTTIELTVTAVDDTTTEDNESFVISILSLPTGYQTNAAYLYAEFTIQDDEWRWVHPAGYADPEDWEPDAIEIIRTGPLFNGELDGVGTTHLTLDYDGVEIRTQATADYYYTYEADTGAGTLDFTCDSQTGEIEENDHPTNLTDDHDWVSAAFGYVYAIEAVSANLHTVDISVWYDVGSGGSYDVQQPTHDDDSGSGGIEWEGAWSWSDNIPSPIPAASVTLQCWKGPDPNA